MARGINKVILVGNVGGDPEVRYMPSGGAVTTLSIATSETWKDKQTGNKQERTEWHRVVCFNRLGEIAGEYVRKGSKLYVEGSLRTRKWQDPQGQDRYTTEIIAANLQMLDGKGQSTGHNDISGFDAEPMYQDSQASSPRQQAPAKKPAASQMAAQEAFDELDDDIPF